MKKLKTIIICSLIFIIIGAGLFSLVVFADMQEVEKYNDGYCPVCGHAYSCYIHLDKICHEYHLDFECPQCGEKGTVLTEWITGEDK